MSDHYLLPPDRPLPPSSEPDPNFKAASSFSNGGDREERADAEQAKDPSDR